MIIEKKSFSYVHIFTTQNTKTYAWSRATIQVMMFVIYSNVKNVLSSTDPIAISSIAIVI